MHVNVHCVAIYVYLVKRALHIGNTGLSHQGSEIIFPRSKTKNKKREKQVRPYGD